MKSITAQRIIARTPEWIHVLGSDESLYLLPTVLSKYSYQHAYCDSALLSVLGIPTTDAAALSFGDDLASETGLPTNHSSGFLARAVIGWRLPSQIPGSTLLQILPLSWLPRITNRDHFLEVLALDLWFRRAGKRTVVFRQTGERIDAVFLPSGSRTGTQRSTVEQLGYHQSAVYSGLEWARIESGLENRLASLPLSRLGEELATLPEIDGEHEILKSLWSETLVNKVSCEQRLKGAVGQLFGGVNQSKNETALEIPADRLRTVSDASKRFSMVGRRR